MMDKNTEKEMETLASGMTGNFWGCAAIAAVVWQYVEHGNLFKQEGETWLSNYGGGALAIMATGALFLFINILATILYNTMVKEFSGNSPVMRILRVVITIGALVLFAGFVGVFFK